MQFTQCTKEGSRAALTVRGCGPDQACEAWGKLADAGLPLRPENFHNLQRPALYPRRDVPNKDLEAVIAAWERGMDTSLKATADSVFVTTQHMLLPHKCSQLFRYHFMMLDKMRTTVDIAAMRQDITDYL